MATDVLDTGDHGIQLHLDYGALEDADTGGAITADTTRVRFSYLYAYVDGNGYPFYDSSNKLVASGGWVGDNTWSNLDINTTNRQKIKTLSPQSQDIVFGKTNGSYNVTLELYNIAAAGETLNGSHSATAPRRPYHLPGAPGATLRAGACDITGHQNDYLLDYYWQNLNVYLEANDVWDYNWAVGIAGTTASVAIPNVENSRYRCIVRASNQDGLGALFTTGYWYTTPAAPSGLAGARQATKSTVVLTWTKNALYSAAELVERSVNGGAYSQIGTSSTGTFTDTTAPVGSTVTYRVRTQTPTSENTAYSAYSNVLDVGVGYSVPDVPATCVLTRNSDTAATVTLSGNVNTSTSEKYWQYVDWQIQTDTGAFGGGGSLAGTTTAIAVSGLSANHRYAVQVRSRNAAGASAWKTSGYIYTTPPAPTGLAGARASITSTQVDLTWASASNWGSLYLVERSLDGGTSWTQLGTTAATNWTDTLPVASSALYRVRAQTPSPALQSAYSGSVAVGFALISDKAKMPGVDHMYVGAERVRRVLLGATIIWTDGDA